MMSETNIKKYRFPITSDHVIASSKTGSGKLFAQELNILSTCIGEIKREDAETEAIILRLLYNDEEIIN